MFPVGIISVKETAAPEGYELDGATYYATVTESGQSETLSTLKTFTGAASLKEQVAELLRDCGREDLIIE